MEPASKRGAALAYVIVITAVLMALAAALVFTAKINIDYSRNSLEGRQAYLDAKSAIEYGKAYLMNKPDSGDFTVVYATNASGFMIGAEKAAGSVASYDSKNMIINAAGKYKSSDRVRRLGYQMKAGSANWSDSDLITGLRHGDLQVFNGSNTNYVFKNGTYNFPVLANQPVKLSGSPGEFSAPEMYFMGANSSEACFEAISNKATAILTANFISFKGDIIVKGDESSLLLNIKSGIVYFDNTQINISGIKTKKLNGYYRCGTGEFNLCNVNAVNALKETTKGIDAFTGNNNFILQNYNKIISGDKDGAGWVGEGRLANGTSGEQPNKIVFVYIITCQNWDNKFKNNKAVYSAEEIHLQYVNSDNNEKKLSIPENKTAILKADKISLSTEYRDDTAGSGSRPRITHNGTVAGFVLEALDAKKSVQLFVPNTLEIQYKNKSGTTQNYLIIPGYYSVTQLNLFSDKAKEFFKDTEPSNAPSGSSGGGSGGEIDVSGGVYTNGQ